MENVWDYPRPPALEPMAKPICIEFAGRTIAMTDAAFRVLETSHPPRLLPASGGFHRLHAGTHAGAQLLRVEG